MTCPRSHSERGRSEVQSQVVRVQGPLPLWGRGTCPPAPLGSYGWWGNYNNIGWVNRTKTEFIHTHREFTHAQGIAKTVYFPKAKPGSCVLVD